MGQVAGPADFGLVGSGGGAGDRHWVDHMRELLESLPAPFTTVWLSDHLQQDGEPWPEGWTRAAYLAAAVPRFRVGHLVLSQSYRNPALLAAMASELQRLSRGRFILGLGAGWMEEEDLAYNYDYPSGGTRVAQLAEAIEIIRGMWTGEP
ncbi:MAG TPA: LLM class flavin-dependent oxidoreductase, partial [Candidatus Limnocylindrales bacterium]